MRQLAVLTVLWFLTACGGSGGGGGGGGAPPVNLTNPAPALTPVASIQMAGNWEIVDRDVVSANTADTDGLEIGTIVQLLPDRVLAVVFPGGGLAAITRQEVEQITGFPVDWYENVCNGATFADFGYGWDKLRVVGGGGAMRDYVQYGVRVIAVTPDLLTGYEAQWTQDFLGQPRLEWLASVTLLWQGP